MMGGLFRYARLIVVLAIGGPSLSGCVTLEGGPGRLYTLQEELDTARKTIEKLTKQYEAAPAPDVRNEIIGHRMYIIDVEYSQYEVGLTRDRQEVGFLTSTVAQGLNVAGALSTPAQTAKILSGLAGGVGAVRGYYDSEIVIAKTIQIAQAQMRTLRIHVSDKIRAAMARPIAEYPLSLAMSDLEEYYRAGTLTAGLIQALGDAGGAADDAAAKKLTTINVAFGPDSNSQILWDYITAPGPAGIGAVRRKQLNLLLKSQPIGSSKRIDEIIDGNTSEAAALRAALVNAARNSIPGFPQ